MPDAFQAMAARADDDRRLLPTGGAPAQRGQIVREDLQRIEDVVEILDLGDRTKAAHGRTDRLSGDGALADSRVHHPPHSMLFLEPEASLVDVAELADVFAEDDEARI